MYTCNPALARFPRYIFEIDRKAPLVLPLLLALVPDPLCALVSFPWPATS